MRNRLLAPEPAATGRGAVVDAGERFLRSVG